jgi:leucyl aminopeptidase
MTIEMVNTDADGRLVLADCLASARREAAERLVNVATLTCGAVTALGFTCAALFVNNEDWAAQLPAAAEQSGERVLRLPLHEEYAARMRSRIADLVSSAEKRMPSHAGVPKIRRVRRRSLSSRVTAFPPRRHRGGGGGGEVRAFRA